MFQEVTWQDTLLKELTRRNTPDPGNGRSTTGEESGGRGGGLVAAAVRGRGAASPGW